MFIKCSLNVYYWICNLNSARSTFPPAEGVCCEVNIADQRKRTPIHLAAAGGHMQADPRTRGTGRVSGTQVLTGFHRMKSLCRLESSDSGH